ncbi:ParB/RepB/Spo0J family partition protein [Puniceibacterium sediminis]|uniref:Chromosome segregation protein Spo0J, contains ParB-like nuclease domain n=1 Tax=Puniceibacterium sediminis TaxID=1608407 RepID=A0A238YMV6_9RHOB|nr:ParB N-terminal domain-containing protein [Puniceibacterium sediminis]SNR72322.1 Chromosome segregation protein Spo0J, contains ParB-like nuclease domain [Puniceibacterium sediminis]
MAKRKRLTPANPTYLDDTPTEPTGIFARAAPIADVARAASSTAAFEEMADTLTRARTEGRMVLELPLDAVDVGYLVRDRIVVEDAEMESLRASVLARGQQTPIEVADLGGGRYGLISGWRRCQALRQLAEQTNDARFTQVLALLRRPDQASDAYLAMVEENEIRVGLSYYERARIVLKAVEQGVFDTQKAALQQLFHAASRAKRSKIGSFLGIVQALDGSLRFPQALAERTGLTLSHALEDDAGLAGRLRNALDAAAPDTPEAEQAVVQSILTPQPAPEGGGTSPAPVVAAPAVSTLPGVPQNIAPKGGRPQNEVEEVAPDLWLRQHGNGALTLSGAALTEDLRHALTQWLRRQVD